MKNAPLLNLVLSVVLVIAVGWLLLVGRSVILPIVTAVIVVYIMGSATQALARLPLLRNAPAILLKIIILAAFSAIFIGFAVVIATTMRDIVRVMPDYQANLGTMLGGIAQRFGVETQTILVQLRAVTVDRIDLQQVLLATLGGFTSVGITVFLVLIYAGFLIAERGSFPQKISAALQDKDSAAVALDLVTQINTQIRQYLAVKTMINVILGLISYAALWVMDVDFALFWAIMIALLNYIPYVGSYLGVAFPVILSLGQFASVQTTLILLALLVAAQVWVGNVLEPRRIGRELNMSPFVVLVALAVWGSIWGVPGAILAIPMTSILMIITSSFKSTRFIAVLLSERTDAFAPEPGQQGGRP